MDLERERGITIKAHPVTMRYTSKSGQTYRLNLLDTPGTSISPTKFRAALPHAKAPFWLWMRPKELRRKRWPTCISRTNKGSRLSQSSQDRSAKRRCGLRASATGRNPRDPSEEAIEASAKMGIGIEEILEAIVKRIPPPQKPADETLRALVFDSVFDVYRGVVGYVRVVLEQQRHITRSRDEQQRAL